MPQQIPSFYDYTGRYHRFNLNKSPEVYKQLEGTYKVVAHKSAKNSFCGKMVLPALEFPHTKTPQEFKKINLGKTRLLIKKNVTWGSAILLVLKRPAQKVQFTFPINAEIPRYKPQRQTWSKMSTHQRITREKTYKNWRLYLPAQYIGSSVKIIKIIPPVVLKSKALFEDGEDFTRIKELCSGYVIFAPNVITKASKTKKATRDPIKETIDLLRKGKNVYQIAKRKKIRRTTVWSHVHKALIREIISKREARDIFERCVQTNVKDDLIVLLEKIKRKDIGEIEELLGSKAPSLRRISYGASQIQKRLVKEGSKHLPPNLIALGIHIYESIWR